MMPFVYDRTRLSVMGYLAVAVLSWQALPEGHGAALLCPLVSFSTLSPGH